MIELTLYGHPTSTYEYVKMLVRRNLEKAGLDVEFNEIHDWEEIVREKITSLPTVRVNGHINMSLMPGQNVNSFIQEVTQKVLRGENYGTMNKIFVPTDFSRVATNALVYAHGLSKTLNSVVNLVHVHTPVVNHVESVVIIDHELEKIKKKKLENHVSNLNQSWVGASNSFIPIDSTFKVGHVVDEVKDICEKEKDDALVIVGSTGSSSKIKQWFGSVTTQLSKSCPSPLLIVPPGATYKNVKSILYAANDVEMDIKAISRVADLAIRLDATIHIVHIQTDDKVYLKDALLAYLNQKFPKCKVAYELIQEDRVDEAINEYSIKNAIDIVAVSTFDRGLLSNIFHKSVSRKLVIFSEVPILIIHVND